MKKKRRPVEIILERDLEKLDRLAQAMVDEPLEKLDRELLAAGRLILPRLLNEYRWLIRDHVAAEAIAWFSRFAHSIHIGDAKGRDEAALHLADLGFEVSLDDK